MIELSFWQRWWMRSLPHRLEINWQVPAFLKACPQPFRGEVLEVGAGPGWTSKRILETFPQVELMATDIDPSATAEFGELENVYGERLKTGSANVLELPFDRESFDIVLAINTFNFLAPDQIQLAVGQVLRALRPGGLIGIKCCGFTVPKTISLGMIKTALVQEQCDILVSEGGASYYIWARKSYPVKGGVVT